YIYADPARRLALLIEEDLPARLNPSDAAVGQDYSIFGDAFSLDDRATHFLLGARQVFWMHTLCPVLVCVCAAETSGRQAEDGLALFRPDDGVGHYVPFEGAGPRRLLGKVQSLLIYA